MRLRYTGRARRHLDSIHDYIAERNPKAATRVIERIRSMIDLLKDFPLIGHEGLVPGTRELVVPGLPYIVVHRIDPREAELLVVLGVYHGAQDRTADPPP